MTRDWMAIEEAREAGRQPDYEEVDTDDCKCSRCETRRQRADETKRIAALEARVAELENRLAAGFPQGVTTTSVSNGNGTACTNCLKAGTGIETGVVISTMPPMYGMKCTACGHHWSKL